MVVDVGVAALHRHRGLEGLVEEAGALPVGVVLGNVLQVKA